MVDTMAKRSGGGRSARLTRAAQVSSDPVPPDPVYVNLEALRRVVPPDSWETHTDADSGQPYYYNPGTGETTWEPPADPGPSSPVPSSPVVPEAPEASEIPEVPEVEWEKYWDEESQRIFYYNPLTREAMWEEPSLLEMQPDPNSPCSPLDPRPPTPETDYPGALDGYPAEDYFPRDDDDGAPLSPQLCEDEVSSPGWQCQTADDGQRFYTSLYSQGLWIESEDEQGKPYFYNPDERLSLWELPQVQIPSPHSLPKASSESSLDSGHVGPWPEPNKPEEKVKTLDKAGVLFRTRTVDRGKRLRKKNWSSSWTVLEGGVLTFFKDSKTSTASGLRQPSTLSTPEFTVELRGAVVSSASRDKSSKKNVLELKSRDGSEYLIRHDSETIIDNWHIAIAEGIRSAELPPESENTSSSGAGERLDGGRDKREEEDRRHLGHSQAAAPPGPENLDSHKVGYKLRKFLLRRPTLQALRDKGYIKDQVFGCSLPVLCEREKRSVPAFVQQCIQAVEARGLDIDGLYRISGNLATIQKLRYRVDHEEHLDLQDGRWEDVHILTGALKLFFRELPEPLFPFSHFQQFIAAVKLQDPAQRSRCTRDLVRTLPSVNQNTMRVLFQHLCRVVEHQEENRMSVQSVAIVFGPTLLKPERDEGNMTVNMVFQNQLVELMLQQCHYIFPEA
uniref:Rho GTPase activating protein 27 n=2 Tax=Ornithorhynchus anatinus TaxID=9258 RepID=A0A6I8P4V1_ORNAN